MYRQRGLRLERSQWRFSHAEWRENPYFDFIKQAYVLTTHCPDVLVKRADEMDPHERDKAQFLYQTGAEDRTDVGSEFGARQRNRKSI